MPFVAHGALVTIPIVPCGSAAAGQPACTPCLMFQAAKNGIDFVLYGLTGPVAAFMIVLAGGMMLLGGASPKTYGRGKAILENALLGVTVILLAWVATNFLIKSIAHGSASDTWYQFTCPEFLAGVHQEDYAPISPGALPQYSRVPYADQGDLRAILGTEGNPTPAEAALGQCPPQYQALADKYHVKCPNQNAPDLIALAQCIYSDPIVAALAQPMGNLSGNGRQSSAFTYDNDHPACNYIRGESRVCSHSVHSCHYGGNTGSQGAEAIDIGAKRASVTVPGISKPVFASELALYCELYRVLVKENKCSSFGFLNYEPAANHSHISTRSCDADGKGLGAQPLGGASGCSFLKPSPAAH